MLNNKVIDANKADEFLHQAINLIDKSDYANAKKKLQDAAKCYTSLHLHQGVSICLAWIALCKYLLKTDDFNTTLRTIEEAKFLAEKTNFQDAIDTNNFISALICFYENNLIEAKSILSKLTKKTTNQFIKEKGLIIINKIQNQLATDVNYIEQKFAGDSNSTLLSLLKIGRLVSAETNLDMLLETTAKETANALNADRCTVFLHDKTTDELWSKVATGMGSEEIRFPANKGLAGYVAKTGNTVNIQDAYNDERFNKEIDTKTGYTTKTILCMPIRNIKHEIIGVFQVLNKNNGVFTEEDEDILIALGSSAGIALENTRLFNHQQKLLEEQKKLFESFIDTLATSIDARDKITSGHSSRVRMYSELICDEMNLQLKDREVIKHAATLHDIGKIGIRDSVLQKEGKLTAEEYEHIQQHASITYDILSKIYLSNEYAQVADIAASHHEKFDGNGYFKKLKGEEIPLGGRILAVADVFDAITSKRHYRDKMPIVEAIGIIDKGAGAHFDPNIVNYFLSIPCDKMVDVFLTEYNSLLKEEHRQILDSYTMKNLYDMLTYNEELTENQKYFIELFNLYYTNKSTGN